MDSEHNRLMREQLLAKLEQDAQLLHAKEQNNLTATNRKGNKDINGNTSNNKNSNKVYKYFSNSARHEYRRGQPLPEGVELDFELPELSKIERECFHLCEKICPLCDEPLKSYESCCLRCQRKLAIKMKQRQSNSSEEERAEAGEPPAKDSNADGVSHDCQNSYALVCLKCERLYAMCSQCLAKSDVCRACQRERNVCMNCRRNLCSFCLEEIACGRDTERTHINEQDEQHVVPPQQTDRSDNAFRVLELNFAVPSPAPETTDAARASPPPYSFNISPNSVFHGDYKPTPMKAMQVDQMPVATASANNSFELDSADEQAMERVRRQTDKRLSRYLKNYGDLATKNQQQQLRSKSESRHRGTQTIPQSLGRRDVVMHESPAHPNLSMPLLREMPRMTRKETSMRAAQGESSQRKMDNLKKRWEVYQ